MFDFEKKKSDIFWAISYKYGVQTKYLTGGYYELKTKPWNRSDTMWLVMCLSTLTSIKKTSIPAYVKVAYDKYQHSGLWHISRV